MDAAHGRADRRGSLQYLVERYVGLSNLQPCRRREIALRVRVHEQHFLPVAGNGCADVQAGRGLARAALLIDNRYDFHVIPFSFLDILMIP